MSADVPNRRLSGRKRLAPISFWENQIVARASDGSFADGTPNIIKAGKSETSMRCANVMTARRAARRPRGSASTTLRPPVVGRPIPSSRLPNRR